MDIFDSIVRLGGKYSIVVAVFGSLAGLFILCYITRIVWNGLWSTPKGDKQTWTTKGGKGTTFVTDSKAFKPGELSSRQKKMKEPTYFWPKAILITALILLCLYTYLS